MRMLSTEEERSGRRWGPGRLCPVHSLLLAAIQPGSSAASEPLWGDTLTTPFSNTMAASPSSLKCDSCFPTLSTHFPSQDALPVPPFFPTAGPLPCSKRSSPSLPHGCRLLPTRPGSLGLPHTCTAPAPVLQPGEGRGVGY